MCANLIHSKKMKAEPSRLISQTCSKDTAFEYLSPFKRKSDFIRACIKINTLNLHLRGKLNNRQVTQEIHSSTLWGFVLNHWCSTLPQKSYAVAKYHAQSSSPVFADVVETVYQPLSKETICILHQW